MPFSNLQFLIFKVVVRSPVCLEQHVLYDKEILSDDRIGCLKLKGSGIQ